MLFVRGCSRMTLAVQSSVPLITLAKLRLSSIGDLRVRLCAQTVASMISFSSNSRSRDLSVALSESFMDFEFSLWISRIIFVSSEVTSKGVVHSSARPPKWQHQKTNYEPLAIKSGMQCQNVLAAQVGQMFWSS